MLVLIVRKDSLEYLQRVIENLKQDFIKEGAIINIHNDSFLQFDFGGTIISYSIRNEAEVDKHFGKESNYLLIQEISKK